MGRRRAQVDPPGQSWERAAHRAVERWNHLDAGERRRLFDQAWTLDRTRFWEGLDGLVVTESMRATIAAQACLLTVNAGLRALKDVTSILLAGTKTTKRTRHLIGGRVIAESHSHVSGETLLHGPLRLAWDQVAADLDGDSGASVVLHEFAHKLDMADGATDGNPPLLSRKQIGDFDRIAEGVLEEMRSGEPGAPLRDYAATNRSELFAVATEVFFLRPDELRARFDGLYGAMATFYRQHPTNAWAPLLPGGDP